MTNDDTHGDLTILAAGTCDVTPKPRTSLADVTILGLRLCPRHKTDAEYIASVRKAVRYSKWMAVMYGALAVFYFGASLGLSYMVFWLMSELTPAESVMDEVSAGAAVGLVFGAIAGCFFVQGGSSFLQMLTIKDGQRTERLMLKFHDELAEREQGLVPTDRIGRS